MAVKDPASHELSVSFNFLLIYMGSYVRDLSSSSDQLNDHSGTARRENILCMKGESVI